MAATNDTGAKQATLTLEVDGDGVACLTFDDPDSKHNILSTPVMEALDATLASLERDIAAGRVRAVVIRSGKERSFFAGADVREIASIEDPSAGARASAQGQQVFQRLATLAVPTVAAVNGVCLGGGTEMILACDRRIVADTDDVKIGLPEVRLGIIPGFGGTTRLPRLIGTRQATEMIATGKAVRARKAVKIGLADERVPGEVLRERALALARDLAQRPKGDVAPRRSTADRLRIAAENSAPGRKAILWAARKQVMKETRGNYPAPLVALDTIDRTLGVGIREALGLESQAVGRLIAGEVSKNLIHVFFLMEGAKKKRPDASAADVERAGVLGAGVMGGGIAQLLAYHGISVRLKDIRSEALSDGLRHARQLFDKAVSRRRLERREADQAMGRISASLDYAGFGSCDLVIEAVVERMDVKKTVLREVETRTSEECVLTTNTSSLSVTEMQGALTRPGRFCGMHFFNPVHRMPLVEVIRGRDSSEEALATVFALTLSLGKTPVVVNDGPGFLVNRLLAPYLNEAGWLLADGASIEEVDGVLKDFGMPMGPFRLLDEVGLDISRHAGETMHEAFGERMRPAPPLVALAGTERLGRKNGRGFYVYENGHEKSVDGSVYGELAPAVPAERATIARSEIRDRTVLVMINEAARVLSDGVVEGPGDVDLGMITGTGFPPFRGGLLRYADAVGLPTVVARLEALARDVGPRFEPAPLLRELAEAGKGFYTAPPA